MPDIIIRHRTCYRYRRPVLLNPHRLMLRPREGRLLQVLSLDITSEPRAELDWTQDVFGNAIAIARFSQHAAMLSLESQAVLRHAEAEWPVFPIAASAITYPFAYTGEELVDLGALRAAAFPDPDKAFEAWVKTFIASDPTDTLSLLKDLNAGISGHVAYEAREDYGTQAPLDSLLRGHGTCRDFATMLAEAARVLGLGARLVSGYLWDPAGDRTGSAGAGATHAWCEIYVPGAGWIAFDPTNRAVGAGHLIPVATGRTIEQIAPITGGFQGAADDALHLSVVVTVNAEQSAFVVSESK